MTLSQALLGEVRQQNGQRQRADSGRGLVLSILVRILFWGWGVTKWMVCFKCFVANQMSPKQAVTPMERCICSSCGTANVDCVDRDLVNAPTRAKLEAREGKRD